MSIQTNYNFSHRLMAYILFIGLFLQSCGGFQNQIVPQEKKQPNRTIELSDNPLINTDKKIVTSGGYLASFYKEDGKLKADLKADEKQPEPNYKGVSIEVEKGTDLASLTKLDPTTQKKRIELNRSQSGQLRHITIRKGGLSGGMMEENEKKRETESESEKAKKNRMEITEYSKLFEFAIKANDPVAQFELGRRAYLAWKEQRTEKSFVDATEWLNKAKIQGHQGAVFLLEEMNSFIWLEKVDKSQEKEKEKEKEEKTNRAEREDHKTPIGLSSNLSCWVYFNNQESYNNINLLASPDLGEVASGNSHTSVSKRFPQLTQYPSPLVTSKKITGNESQEVLIDSFSSEVKDITKIEGSLPEQISAWDRFKFNTHLSYIPVGEIKYDSMIASGGFGKVYRASCRQRRQEIAVKKLHDASKEQVAQFLNEAIIMANLHHPNFVPFIGFCPEENAIIMEYMPEGSLWSFLKKHQKDSSWDTTWQLRYRIALDVAKGMSYLHDCNIIHYDLKSENVLLDRKKRAKITDFGLSSLKTENSTFGPVKPTSLRWLDPELLRIKKPDKANDVYNYGMLLWQLGARKQPFEDHFPTIANDIIDILKVSNYLLQGNREIITDDTPEDIKALIKSCWLPMLKRPKMWKIRSKLMACIEKEENSDTDTDTDTDTTTDTDTEDNSRLSSKNKPIIQIDGNPAYERLHLNTFLTDISKEEIEYGDNRDRLGAGGQGCVYQASYRGKVVAVKRLLDLSIAEKEAMVMANHRHPNLITFLGFCSAESALVMEYMPGGSLWSLLKSSGDILWETRCKIALDVAEGMCYLHGVGILHRDLKSENILLASDRKGEIQAKVTDFGTVALKSEHSTFGGGLAGTYCWMAPEVLGKEENSKAGDVYSYGMILWQLGARKQPFEEVTNLIKLAKYIVAGNREVITEDTPIQIRKIIEQCWLEADKRPAMKQIRHLLEKGHPDFLDREYNDQGSSLDKERDNPIQLKQKALSTLTPSEIILFLGNPGVGKSSLCNSIFMNNIFKSGISIGQGIWKGKHEYIYENRKYIDTPGLYDIKIREQAAEQIEKALKENNNYKIIFVTTLEAGKIRPADLVTINMVCDAIRVPFEYGIIVNKVTKPVMRKINDQGLKGYVDALNKQPASIVIIKKDESMEEAEDVYLSPNSENRKDLISFISDLKANTISAENVAHLDVNNYEERIREMEGRLMKIFNSKMEMRN